MERVFSQREFSPQRERTKSFRREKSSINGNNRPSASIAFSMQLEALSLSAALRKPLALKFYPPFSFDLSFSSYSPDFLPLQQFLYRRCIPTEIFFSSNLCHVRIPHLNLSVSGEIFEWHFSASLPEANTVQLEFSETLWFIRISEERNTHRHTHRVKAHKMGTSARYDQANTHQNVLENIANPVADRSTIRFRLFFRHPPRVFTRIAAGENDSIRARYC